LKICDVGAFQYELRRTSLDRGSKEANRLWPCLRLGRNQINDLRAIGVQPGKRFWFWTEHHHFRGIFINSLLVDVENVAAGSPVGEE
jgi:hypothetical protein